MEMDEIEQSSWIKNTIFETVVEESTQKHEEINK